MAFRDDGLILAAGTSNGRVVFYDVRGKPEPYIVLRAYSSSEVFPPVCYRILVCSLSWCSFVGFFFTVMYIACYRLLNQFCPSISDFFSLYHMVLREIGNSH